MGGKSPIGSERVDEISGKLILVALKAESKVRQAEPPLTAEELKTNLIKNNPVLLTYFNSLTLKFQIQERHVIALVCDKDQNYAIVEDSACTAEIDRKDITGKMPCTFTLQTSRICIHQ
jgi:hypothetical protein